MSKPFVTSAPCVFFNTPLSCLRAGAWLNLLMILIRATAMAATTPGHVEGWGVNAVGQATPPPGLDGVIAVAGGGEHSLGLRTNGTVIGWGGNREGQTDIPAGLSNVIAIAAAGHSVALTRQGRVVVWGHFANEVTNVPTGVIGVSAVAAGNSSGNPYTLALLSSGTVVGWGLNSGGTAIPPGLTDVVGIAAGNYHGLALKRDGSVVGWGDNNDGQASPPPGLSGVVAVRAGQGSSFAVRSNGTIVQWGSFAAPPAALDHVTDLQVGLEHAIALLSSGLVVAWGINYEGEGLVPAGLNGVSAISAGGNHNLIVTARPQLLSISTPVVSNPGATVTFEVTATGQPLNFQWLHRGVAIAGATGPSLTLTNVRPADSGDYAVRVRNACGDVIASTSLSFAPPVISLQPQSVDHYRTEDAVFRVAATGLAPFTFQWSFGDTPIAGATNDVLLVPRLRVTEAGGYFVVVTDSAGASAVSAVARLTVIDPNVVTSVELVPVADTSISSASANPQGIGSILAGTRANGVLDRGLLRFDLAAIPSGAVFRAATLRLAVTRAPRNPANSNFSLHRVFKDWGADAAWASATAGKPWSGPGGLPGVDYSATSSATVFIENVASYDFGPSNGLAADLQWWLNSPDQNHGWMLLTENERVLRTARHFGSSESATPPRLLLEYSVRPPAPRLTNIEPRAGRIGFRFDGRPAWLYRVESRDTLDRGIWSIVTNVPPLRAPSPILISVPVDSRQRFYRVIAD